MRPKPTRNSIEAVLFDLDGTLLDTAPDLVASLNHLRAGLGLAAIPVPDLRHYVSQGATGLIKAGMPACDEETMVSWRESFLQHYQHNSFVHTRPFDGIEGLLSELDSRAIPWGIVTNKAELFSIPILQKTGWMSAASVVICGDTCTHSKPHPEPVMAACRAMGTNPANVIMIGDDLRDVEAGKRAGCRTALVLYGYMEQSGTHATDTDTTLINTPHELLGLLTGTEIF